MSTLVVSEKLADVSWGVSFADGDNHGLFGIGKTGPDGQFHLTFAVPADAALGDAKILVAAVGDHGGGNGMGSFRVVDAGGCS